MQPTFGGCHHCLADELVPQLGHISDSEYSWASLLSSALRAKRKTRMFAKIRKPPWLTASQQQPSIPKLYVPCIGIQGNCGNGLFSPSRSGSKYLAGGFPDPPVSSAVQKPRQTLSMQGICAQNATHSREPRLMDSPRVNSWSYGSDSLRRTVCNRWTS